MSDVVNGVIHGLGKRYADGTEPMEIWVPSDRANGLPYSNGLSIPINLQIDGEIYHAGLRATEKNTYVWISPDLRTKDGASDKLVYVLARAGFKKNDKILLLVEGHNILVKPDSSSAAPPNSHQRTIQTNLPSSRDSFQPKAKTSTSETQLELVGRGNMRDPLANFDWSSLYLKYDARCVGFDKNSGFLGTLMTNLPNSDRTLYYRLLDLFSIKHRNSLTDPIGAYEAMLYWKLYSQSTSSYTLPKWLREDASKRIKAQENLLRLFQEIPTTVDRSPLAIVELVKWLDRFKLPGMATSTTLPVRTTFLHFLYPSVVPIFDKMVLKAVNGWEKDANHKISFLRAYLPLAWELADRYTQLFSPFTRESPIRVIDMALWVNRGDER